MRHQPYSKKERGGLEQFEHQDRSPVLCGLLAKKLREAREEEVLQKRDTLHLFLSRLARYHHQGPSDAKFFSEVGIREHTFFRLKISEEGEMFKCCFQIEKYAVGPIHPCNYLFMHVTHLTCTSACAEHLFLEPMI